MSAEVADVLRDALALIEDERNWCGDQPHGQRYDDEGVLVARCSAHAINHAGRTSHYEVRLSARNAVLVAAGLPPGQEGCEDGLPTFNDTHTHAEVVAAFKSAIVAEEWDQ